MLTASLRHLRARLGARAAAVARQGMTTVVDQGVVSATNFLTGVILARSTSGAELGLYSLGFSVVLVLTSIQTSLVSAPYNVYCLRVLDEERAAYTGSTLVHQLGITAGSMAALALAGLVLARSGRVPGLAPVMWVLAATVPFWLAREYGRQLFFSRLRFGSALLLDGVVAVVQLGSLVGLARAERLSARHAYAVTGMACGIAVLCWAVMARHLLGAVRGRVLASFRMNWVTGRWSLAANAVSVGAAQLYPWFIAGTKGAEQAGVLAACMGITALTNPLLIGMGNYLAPKIMHAYAEGGLASVQRVTRIALGVYVAVMAVMCPLLFLSGGTLLRFVYGGRYGGHGLTVGLLSLALVADWLSLPAHYALFFMDRAQVMFKSNLIVLGATVTLGFALVSVLGASGAALGLLAGNAAATLFKWREYRKRIGAATASEAIAAAAALGVGP